MYRGYALIAPMVCTGAMWRMLRVGRILICVHTTNKDCLLLLLLLLLLQLLAEFRWGREESSAGPA